MPSKSLPRARAWKAPLPGARFYPGKGNSRGPRGRRRHPRDCYLGLNRGEGDCPGQRRWWPASTTTGCGGIPLAADPTVVYAALLNQRYRGAIYQSDLRFDSAYNTYKHAGLPPGPVANPGSASLRAAMSPERTNYLYFVADGQGGHRFTSSYEEHSRNVAAYRRAERYQSEPSGRHPIKRNTVVMMTPRRLLKRR